MVLEISNIREAQAKKIFEYLDQAMSINAQITSNPYNSNYQQ